MYVKCLAYSQRLIHADPLPFGPRSAHAPVPEDYTRSTPLLRELEERHLISALKWWLSLHLPSPSSQIPSHSSVPYLRFPHPGGGGGGREQEDRTCFDTRDRQEASQEESLRAAPHAIWKWSRWHGDGEQGGKMAAGVTAS